MVHFAILRAVQISAKLGFLPAKNVLDRQDENQKFIDKYANTIVVILRESKSRQDLEQKIEGFRQKALRLQEQIGNDAFANSPIYRNLVNLPEEIPEPKRPVEELVKERDEFWTMVRVWESALNLYKFKDKIIEDNS